MEDDTSHAASHSYFIPMVDMLASVVFVLVILLASVTLVSREDFPANHDAQTEITRIQRELSAARNLEQTILQPRRDAQAVLEALLNRLRSDLKNRGVVATVDPAQGRLEIDAPGAFTQTRSVLSGDGDDLAATVADVLAREVPCVAPRILAKPAECSGNGAAVLERIVVGVSNAPDVATSGARSLRFIGAMAGVAPTLLALQSMDGEPLINYRAFLPVNLIGERNVLTFQMDVPPFPAP